MSKRLRRLLAILSPFPVMIFLVWYGGGNMFERGFWQAFTLAITCAISGFIWSMLAMCARDRRDDAAFDRIMMRSYALPDASDPDDDPDGGEPLPEREDNVVAIGARRRTG